MAIGLKDLEDGDKSAADLSAEFEQSPEVQPPTETPPEPEVIPPQEQPPVAETPPVEETPAPEPPREPEQPQVFDMSSLNENLNTQYESIEQLQAALNKPSKETEYNELEAKHTELQELLEKSKQDIELLTEQLDPATLFSSENAMKLEAFKKANPKKDPSIAQTVFSTEDLSSIDDLEMVKMGWKFNSPKKLKGTEKDLEAAIAEELGQDSETPVSEWSVSAQNRLTRMAGQYVSQFDQLRTSVDLPKKIDIEELRNQRTTEAEQRLNLLQEGWNTTAEETLKDIHSVKVPIGAPKEGEEQQFFEWDLGSSPKEEVELLKEQYIKSGLSPDEMKESFQRGLELTLIDKHLPQIMQKYGEDILARENEKHLDQSHNPAPLADTVRQEPTGSEKELKERSAFALDGLGSSLHGHPLFKKT
jgi:hypothetical protein